MIEFHILGSTTLRKEDGDFDHSFLAGPKRLGLLTYLTLARPRGYQRRDKLVALFWPERGQKSARNALSNMLYHIRDALGEESIINRGTEEISINPGKIWCDAIAFDEALDEGEVHKALDLYHGEPLAGFHVTDISNEFNSWLDRERERLRQRAMEASWMLAEKAEQAGDLTSARRWAKKAAGHRFFSEEVQARLIQFLDGVGYREDALEAYEKFAGRLKREWEMEPSDELNALAEEIRNLPKIPSTTFKKENKEGKNGQSIAVLPFETLGAENATAFTNGIHGDILTRLTNISDLQVISRTSVRQYVNTKKTVKEISNELNATWLLEGDIQENSGRVQFNVRLIHAENDAQIWSKNYRRKLNAKNLFQIQSAITKEIADALKTQLSPEEKKQVEQHPTESLDAYRLYMQGWSWAEQRTEKGFRRALDYFGRAIEKDANYTLAKVGRAFALIGLNDYGFEEAESVLPEAETLIHRALEQNDDLPAAHAALANLLSVRHEGAKTIEELKRAVELRPGYSDAHNWLSWNYQLLGKPEQALIHAKKAVELDPFSPEAVSNLSLSYLTNCKFSQAVNAALKTRKLLPTWTTGPFYEGVTYYQMGKYDEAISIMDGLSVPWADEGPRITLALACVAIGDESVARDHLAYFKDIKDHFAIGMTYAALGENERALTAFEQIKRWEHWPTLSLHYFYSDVLEPIKNEPRFKKVVESMKRSRA